MTFKKTALLTTIASDSHSWNLVFMEFLLTDLGYKVENLGPNTPVDDVLNQINRNYYDMVIVSSVNGHGYIEGQDLARRIRQDTNHTDGLYIGGKICTDTYSDVISKHAQKLRNAGFDDVFDDSMVNSFDAFQEVLTTHVPTVQPMELRAAN